MEEKKYHLPESNHEEGMAHEPSPAYARTHAHVAYSAPSATAREEWEEDEDAACDTDGYPLGRSLEQVMEHCEEVEKHWDDPNYWMSWEEFDEHLRKTIPGWR